MRPAARYALYGAGIGAGAAFLRSLVGDTSNANYYIPQTTFGVVAESIGYMIPWAAIGGLIGFAVGRRRPAVAPVTDTPARTSPAAPTTALQRLGHVLGWTGNGIAALLIGVGIYGFTNAGGDAFVKGATVVAGIAAYLIGRALRYIFAGSGS